MQTENIERNQQMKKLKNIMNKKEKFEKPTSKKK